jgi:hypothetical protein
MVPFIFVNSPLREGVRRRREGSFYHRLKSPDGRGFKKYCLSSFIHYNSHKYRKQRRYYTKRNKRTKQP